MKRKFLAFPLLALALSPNVMAGQFIWTGGTDSAWTNPANWDITSSVPVSPDPYPIPGTTYASDFLNIRNNGNLTIDPTGTTPGADAVYNPGAGITTTFNGGRCFVIGTGTGPDAILPNLPNRKGYAKLTVSSGTIVGARTANVGSEAYMANRADTTLLINGGNVDLSAHLNNFRLIQEGLSGITSTITIDSGSLSCRSLDLVFDQESVDTGPEPQNVFGTGIINLNGGTFNMLRFVRTAASDPGQTSFTFNLNGGTLRPLVARTDFLPALADLKTVVKAGGAIINTTTPAAPNTPLALTINGILEHDETLGSALDGGLTKDGPGTLTLSGANTFNGPVTINAGTALATPSRLLLASNSAAGTGAITLADSFTEIQVNNTRNIANSITISDTGAEKTLLLPSPGGGNFAGATFSGPITIDETNIDHFRIRADDNCFLTLSGLISGPGGIYKFQNGVVTLSNPANDFTGGVKITAGTISFFTGGLGTSGSILMDGGALRWNPTNDEDVSSRIVMVNGKTATFNMMEGGDPYDISNVSFANAIGNGTTAALTKTGPGTLTLTQASTYSGGTTVTQGTLEFANDGIGTSGPVTMNGGIFRWATSNTQDLSSRIVMVDARTASFSTNGNDVTFANAIGSSSTASLTKTNTLGTLTLNGTNTYTGTTTVGGGTLKLAAGATITASASVTIGAGATLDTSDQATYSVPAGQSLAFGINAGGSGSAGNIAAAGLDVSNATVTYTITGTPDDPVYVLATYTGTLAGTFLSVPAPPTGYTLKYDHEGNKIALVQDAVSGFAAWKAANGNPSGGLGDDHDGDGVDNGTEYFLFGNTSSTGFTALPGVINIAGVLSVTWTKAATGYAGVYGTDFVVETSDTLTGWTPVTPPTVVDPQPVGTVKITGNDVKYIFPTAGPKQFARLKVTGPN